jgi:ESF2/ABP1 family protein
MPKPTADSRFVVDDHFEGETEAEASSSQTTREAATGHQAGKDSEDSGGSRVVEEGTDHSGEDEVSEQDGFGEGMLAEGFSGPSAKIVKPLTAEDLAKYKAAQEKTGVVYISRIPPGMRPTKVRHLMSGYGEIGRVYLQPEGAS